MTTIRIFPRRFASPVFRPVLRKARALLIAASWAGTAGAQNEPAGSPSVAPLEDSSNERPSTGQPSIRRGPPPSAPAVAPSELRSVPRLSVVLQQAQERAPQVRLGTAALDVSRTSSVNARRPALANPYVEVVAQRGTQGTTQGVNWNGTVWLPLELSGQRGRRITEAEAFEDTFEASLHMARASAQGEAIAAYGAVQAAAERVRVLENIVAVSQVTAELYEARLAAGDVVLRDATLARVDVARNQVLLQEARGRLAAALADLNRITGDHYNHFEPSDVGPPSVDMAEYQARAVREAPPSVATAEAEAKYYAAQRERLGSETVGPFSLMLMGGQGDFGEARFGAGIAYEIPVLRSFQGEKARADAEKLRAQTEASVRRSLIDHRIRGIVQQYRQDRKAYEVIKEVALPAAEDAVRAAEATFRAGKDEPYLVLLSRRDQAMLALQQLDLLERQWMLLGELVQLTGELP